MRKPFTAQRVNNDRALTAALDNLSRPAYHFSIESKGDGVHLQLPRARAGADNSYRIPVGVFFLESRLWT